ncbi:hypothetical protein RUM44_006719 [Polyplax serrata]|uniref:TOG domain-containing protein n=1 Tax=Polyplax serrata TaxID=468196 RepID=A0ABR1AIY2_POLSC
MKTHKQNPVPKVMKSKSSVDAVSLKKPSSTRKQPTDRSATPQVPKKSSETKRCAQRFSTPKSETYIYKNFKLRRNSLPCHSSACSRLIPSPEAPTQPKETLRKGLIRLKSSQLNESILGLKDIVQISRFNPQLVVKYIPIVYNGITLLLQNSRTTATRTACQAANELFINVQPVQVQELEELVFGLLRKTEDSNERIAEDASEALDSLIIQVPPTWSIKILLHKRIATYGTPARLAAAKLLVYVINTLGTELGEKISREAKTRLVNAAVRFLQDDCFEIKTHGMNLVTMFMRNKDFTDIFQTKFTNPMLKKMFKNRNHDRRCVCPES